MQRHQQRGAVQRLIRKHGAKVVSGRCGVSVNALASFVAQIGRTQPGTQRAIELAFEQLGPTLGLEPAVELPRAKLTPRLTLVKPAGSEAL